MQCIAWGYCTNYWAITKTGIYSEHCQTFKRQPFVKRIMNECRCAARYFSGQGEGGFAELGDFNKHFVKNTRKKGPAGKRFGVFSPRYS